MVKSLIKLTIYYFLLSSFTLAADNNPDSWTHEKLSSYGNQKLITNSLYINIAMLHDRKGKRRDDVTDKDVLNRVNFVLSNYGLDKPENFDLQQEIIGRLTLMFAQNIPEEKASFDEDGNYTTTTTSINHSQTLESFEKAIENSSINLSLSQLDKAKKLREISQKYSTDHKKYLLEVEKNFSGKELTTIIGNSVHSFNGGKGMYRDFVKSMAKGELDQDFLYEIIEKQLKLKHPKSDLYDQELLDTAIKYFDFNKRYVGQFGQTKETLLCDIAKDILENTNYINGKPAQNKEQVTSNYEIIKDLYLNYGTALTTTCDNGYSPKAIIDIAVAEGIFPPLEDDLSLKSNAPCTTLEGNPRVPELCLSLKVLFWLEDNNRKSRENILNKNEGYKNTSYTNLNENNCSFTFLNTFMQSRGKAKPLDSEIKIESPTGDTYKIKAKDHESLVKELNKLSKN